MKLSGILASFMCAFSAYAADLDQKTLEGFWKEIVFNTKQASQMSFDIPVRVGGAIYAIPNAKCYIKPEYFVGCVKAVSALGSLLSIPKVLVATQEIGNAQWIGSKVVRDLGPLTLIEASPNRKNNLVNLKPKERIDLIRSERDSLLAAGTEIINEAKKASQDIPVDFHELVAGFLSETKPDVVEGQKAVAIASGFFMGIDAHAHIDLTKVLRANASNADISLTGIGAEVSQQDGLTVIVRPMPGGPAEKLGLLPGDAIVKVDHQSVRDIPLDKVVSMLRGQENTKVHVTYIRAGLEMEIEIIRARIVTLNVEARIVSDVESVSGPGSMKLGLIRLKSFQDDNGCSKIEAAMTAMQSGAQPVQGFILDLRGNPGGNILQAQCVGGLFAGRQDIVYSKDLSSGKVVATYAGKSDAITKLPVVVLIDGHSASASEIVSGALQGLKRAWVAGDRSFGKATVQTGLPMQEDSNLYLFRTTNRFYTPVLDEQGVMQSRTNQRVGVVPDFAIPVKPQASAEELFVMREADMYPDSLDEDTKQWDLIRPMEAARIQKCMDTNGRADKLYAAKRSADFQLLKAQEILACESGQ